MYDLTQPLLILRPSETLFGAGTLQKLAGWVAERGFKRPVVIADRVNAARIEVLGLASVACHGDLAQEPDLGDLTRAVEAASGADLVIGFGGGSAMDLAKLVAVMVDTDLTLDQISGPDRAPARRVGLVQIPTTAGTGSEVGTRALITNPETLAKVATESRHMLADLAIVDPELTVSVPAAITAATGLDALAHCVEAYTSKRAHPLIDAYALEGIRLVGRHLKRAVEDGTDLEARAGLALASFYGGVCLGPVNTTAGHAVAYPLGTRFKLPHGLANALIFPHTLAANAPAQPAKTEAILAELGAGKDPVEAARLFCEGVGMTLSLKAQGVTEDSLPLMAQEAHAIRRLLDWNPVDLSVADIETIYRAAW
ncbi:iron-containing alcohol dehydrogenase [Cereibacter sphaeroides]|nr:iron-containing alcohol dehydrogenase [Cereibacter sphaeroides]